MTQLLFTLSQIISVTATGGMFPHFLHILEGRIRLFCWLVGWFEIQNTCFLCLCDVADFFFKRFQYIQDVKRMGLFISLCHFIECDWVISRRGPIRWDAGICILFARPQQICERCLLMLENELLRRPTDFKSLLIHYCKMVLKQVVSKIGTFVQTDNFVR